MNRTVVGNGHHGLRNTIVDELPEQAVLGTRCSGVAGGNPRHDGAEKGSSNGAPDGKNGRNGRSRGRARDRGRWGASWIGDAEKPKRN